MDLQSSGVLPNQTILDLWKTDAIRANTPLDEDQIQPASLDLRLGKKAWRLRASYLPGSQKTVAERRQDFEMHEIDLTSGAVLERGCVYLVEIEESLKLPPDIWAVANAKSSTGRLDILTRLIADGGIEFDRIDAGYRGPLYAEICPRSFSVLVQTNLRLNQIRFKIGTPTLSDEELRQAHSETPLIDEGQSEAQIDQGLGFSVDLSARAGPVGFRAKRHTGLIDLSKLNHYDISEYWEPLTATNGRIVLDPGAFYILVSKQSVCIPPEFAAEMAPFLAMVGEFRVHYAGFFDPGFGYIGANGRGARGVLEVRAHEAPFALEDGQSVGRLLYERMKERPTVLYGSSLKSNYQGQGLKLSKHFKEISES